MKRKAREKQRQHQSTAPNLLLLYASNHFNIYSLKFEICQVNVRFGYTCHYKLFWSCLEAGVIVDSTLVVVVIRIIFIRFIFQQKYILKHTIPPECRCVVQSTAPAATKKDTKPIAPQLTLNIINMKMVIKIVTASLCYKHLEKLN